MGIFNPMNTTYLDYNATAPVWPEVVEAVSRGLAASGNASSVHSEGRAARQMVEEAREKVAALVNARPGQVIFTGGGTEANNLAMWQAELGRVTVSPIEHESVLKPLEHAARLRVQSDGVVDVNSLPEHLDGLVSVMLANNETGVLQPVKRLAELCRERGVAVHTDAIQAVGKINVDWRDLGVQMMSISAHKLGGPQGVGALIVDDTWVGRPLLKGGGQERGRRAGTENIAGITGFGVAAELVQKNFVAMANVTALRDMLEHGLRAIDPTVIIHGGRVERLPNTVCASMPGVDAETQVMSLDLAGVMVSAGSACSSGKVTTSHVLKAMGLDDASASSAIRISLGWHSTPDDVEKCLTAWRDLYTRTRCTQAAAAE